MLTLILPTFVIQRQKKLWQNLLRGAMLLMIGSILCSCVSKAPLEIQTKIISVLAKPAIPPIPQAPNLADLLPQGITVTAEDVSIYAEACEAWRSNEYTEVEILKEFSLSQSAACDWAIFGYTIQGEITSEMILNSQADYVEQLRNYIDFLIETIKNMVEVSSKNNK